MYLNTKVVICFIDIIGVYIIIYLFLSSSRVFLGTQNVYTSLNFAHVLEVVIPMDFGLQQKLFQILNKDEAGKDIYLTTSPFT